MKYIYLVVFAILISFKGFGQTSSTIVSKLHYGEAVAVDDIELEFVKVISDSRCPKNVQCIRAGEAIVLVDVFKKGEFLEQRRLTFYPSLSKKSLTTLFFRDGVQISALHLAPYPKGLSKIKAEDYYLELSVNYAN